MKEQISEELVRKILECCVEHRIQSTFLPTVEAVNNFYIDILKQEGYIKQSREEEIREELNSGYSFSCNVSNPLEEIIKYIDLQKELIDILDNKIKELKNEE